MLLNLIRILFCFVLFLHLYFHSFTVRTRLNHISESTKVNPVLHNFLVFFFELIQQSLIEKLTRIDLMYLRFL